MTPATYRHARGLLASADATLADHVAERSARWLRSDDLGEGLRLLIEACVRKLATLPSPALSATICEDCGEDLREEAERRAWEAIKTRRRKRRVPMRERVEEAITL